MFTVVILSVLDVLPESVLKFYRGGISDELSILYDARLNKNRLLQTRNLRYILSIVNLRNWGLQALLA